MGGDATAFLDNVGKYERKYFFGTYFSAVKIPFRKGKERVQEFMFKDNCVFALFGKKAGELGLPKSLEDGFLPNIEFSGGEVGYWIYKNREAGVADEKIYGVLVEARDIYLRDTGLHAYDFAVRKTSRRVYDAVRKSMKDLSLGEGK